MTEPISRAQWRQIGGSRGALLTFSDQVVSSTSNFVLGVLVARAGGADALGSFGIALLIWLTLLGAHRALVTEPMTVTGSLNSGAAQLREGMLASLGLGMVSAGVLLAVTGVLLFTGLDVVAVVALAPWIPCLLLQDYWRGMAFRLQRPDHALINDVVFAIVQGLVAFVAFVLDIQNVAVFLASWGIGATAGAVIGLRLARVSVSGRGGFAHLRRLWPRSRWFLAEFGTTFAYYQGYQLLLPVLLGTAAFGAYRAGVSLLGPALVIFLAAGNVGLPGCVKHFRSNGVPGLRAYTRRLTVVVLGLIVSYCAAVTIFASPLLRLVYGPQLTDGAVVAQLAAVQFGITAIGLGCDIALKATGRMRRLWVTRVFSAIVCIICVSVFPAWLGLVGAGLVGVLAGVAYTIGVTVAYTVCLRNLMTSEAGDGHRSGILGGSGLDYSPDNVLEPTVPADTTVSVKPNRISAGDIS